MPHVTVTTGARLHFGLLAHAPGAPRRFGGVGLMVERPGFQVSATLVGESSTASLLADRTVPSDDYLGPSEWRSRVLELVHRCREVSRRQGCQSAGNTRWALNAVIPSHVGLGSGTQLGLAVAQAWTQLHRIHSTSENGSANADSTVLAQLAARGVRSALGIHGFQHGGLLVEAGKRSSDQISPLVARANFPSDWRILLVCPSDERGLSGSAEVAAFAALPSMSDGVSAALCRMVLLELLPAVHEADFETCSDALFRFGWLIGEYFAPAQGGVFASQRMARLVDWLRRKGVAGVGQSSWGPMVFALCPDAGVADALQRDLLATNWGDCDIVCVAAKNSGAHVDFNP
jgi:beta-ribofuranosylaminobenzene 5'-phosphate synthase